MVKNITFLSLLLVCLTPFLASAFRLPDSGQTKCYQSVSPYAEIPCAATGQDGEYGITPPSFTDNGNGTVTDSNTGLMWQKCSIGQNNDTACSGSTTTYNWYKASGTYHATSNPSTQSVCGALELGGHSDWRLPSKKELMSVVAYNVPYPGPTINAVFFPNTRASNYWSSSAYAGAQDAAWGLYFGHGYIYGLYKTGGYSVRCVRSGE